MVWIAAIGGVLLGAIFGSMAILGLLYWLECHEGEPDDCYESLRTGEGPKVKRDPVSLDEFRARVDAEKRRLREQLAELYIHGKLPAQPGRACRRPVPKPPPPPTLYLPGMDPKK